MKPILSLLLVVTTSALGQVAAPAPTVVPPPSAPASSGAPRKPDAVLLGISSDGQELRTYFVDAYRIDSLGGGLAVPRKDGWWFLDARGGRLIVAKGGELTAGAALDLNDSNCADGERGGFSQSLAFVLPDWVSLESTHSTQSCSSFLETSRTWAGTVKLSDADGLRMVGASDPIEELLGPEAAAALDRVAPAAERVPGECGLDECDPDRGWVLRPTGAVAVKPEATSDPSSSTYTEVPLEATLLARLQRVTAWKTLDASKGEYEVSAPSGAFTLRIGPGGVAVFAGERHIGTISGASPRTRVVMEEWVYGEKSIERWRKDAAKVLERAAKAR